MLLKQKRLYRNACRLTQRAATVCYQTAVCPQVLAPLALSLISSVTDVAWILASSENELESRQDIILLELEVCFL